MKKTLKLTHLVALFLICSQSFAQNPPITNGLVGYWKFNYNYGDAIGNYSNISTYGNITFSTDMQSNESSACLFNGSSCLIVNDAPSINLSNFSISVWINAISFGSNYNGIQYGRIIRKESDFDLSLFNNNGSSNIYFNVNATSLVAPNNSITLNAWHHIVATYNSLTIKLYIDGQEVCSTGLTTRTTNNNPIIIGNYNSGSIPRFFNGKMENFLIYNRALAQTEVEELFLNSSDDYKWSCINQNLIYKQGNIGIGTSSPDEKLTVKGKIHSEEVLIDLNVPAPDFVFEKDYPLIDIEKIESYINEHKHLPEIPSAGELEKNGIQLGEMNMKLLQKIEELTLYIIEMDKEIKSLKDKNEILEKKVNELEVTK
jgi:hypothetical protein